MNEKEKAFNKCKMVITSCKTKEHFYYSLKYNYLFLNKFKDRENWIILMNFLEENERIFKKRDNW